MPKAIFEPLEAHLLQVLVKFDAFIESLNNHDEQIARDVLIPELSKLSVYIRKLIKPTHTETRDGIPQNDGTKAKFWKKTSSSMVRYNPQLWSERYRDGDNRPDVEPSPTERERLDADPQLNFFTDTK